MLQASNISKAFGPAKVLSGVEFAVSAGSVHALTGENGAGKSTLMKIIAGVHKADAGEVALDGKTLALRSPLDALRAGISTVFQEFTLIPNLTIAENVFLGREPTKAGGGIDYATMTERTRALLARVGLSLDPGRLVGSLMVADQQMIEIAKGLSADAKVFIFDEPTAALNSADVRRLEELIVELRDAGKAIIYISHRLNEIFSLCDTVTILKDGRLVKTVPTADLDENGLVALMVGRELSSFFPPRGGNVGEAALIVEDMRLTAESPQIGFTLKRGEILGLAGLEGQGQRDIARVIVGLESAHQAYVSRPIASSDAHRRVPVEAGIAFIPEDRKAEGLFLDLDIGDNIAIGVEVGRPLASIAPDTGSVVASLIQSMRIGRGAARIVVKSLSGGNQQKVLLARWLAAGVDILVIEEPTRGVDVGAKAEIYRQLREFTAGGGAIVVLSREAPELIGLCDRILTVYGGAIVDEMSADDATEHRILHSALSTRSLADAGIAGEK